MDPSSIDLRPQNLNANFVQSSPKRLKVDTGEIDEKIAAIGQTSLPIDGNHCYLNNFPRELLQHILEFIAITERYKSAFTVSKFFLATMKSLECPALNNSWKNEALRHFPESVASIQNKAETDWVDFYKKQTITKRNFLNSIYKSKKVYLHINPTLCNFDTPLIQHQGFIISKRCSSVKIWDFEDNFSPNKFELYTDDHIYAYAQSKDLACALIPRKVIIWDLKGSNILKLKMTINNLPNFIAECCKLKLIDIQLFFVGFSQGIFSINLNLDSEPSLNFDSLTKRSLPFSTFLSIDQDRVIGLKDNKIIVLNTVTHALICELKPEKDYKFSRFHTLIHENKIITLLWRDPSDLKDWEYKFYVYDFDTGKEICSPNEPFISNFGFDSPYIWNNTYYCFYGEKPVLAFDITTGQIVPLPPINHKYGTYSRFTEAFNGTIIARDHMLDLKTGKTYRLSFENNWYKCLRWSGSKLIEADNSYNVLKMGPITTTDFS